MMVVECNSLSGANKQSSEQNNSMDEFEAEEFRDFAREEFVEQ